MSNLAKSELLEAEKIIERNLVGFYEVGKQLARIRDDRLYHIDRGGEFDTFEKYVNERWGWDRRRAYQLIEAAGIADDVKHVSHPIENARQASELSKLKTPEARREAWSEAVKTAPGGKVTAAHVREVVNTKTGEVIDPDDVQVVKTSRLKSEPQKASRFQTAERRWIAVTLHIDDAEQVEATLSDALSNEVYRQLHDRMAAKLRRK